MILFQPKTYLTLLLFIGTSLFAASFLSAQSPVEIVIQTGHYDEIQALAFSPDGKYLASGGKDGKVIIWDLTTGKLFREMKAHGDKGVTGVTTVIFSNDGKRVIAGGDRRDNLILCWDWATGDTIWTAKDVMSGACSAMEVSHDGTLLAIGTYRSMTMLNLENGEVIWTVKSRGSYKDLKIHHTVDDFDFSKDDKKLVYCYQDFVHIVDAQTGEILFNKKVREQDCDPEAVAFGPKDKTIYATGNSKDFTVWDVATQELVSSYEMPTGNRPCPCTFNPEGTTFFGACSGRLLSLQAETEATNFLMKREGQNGKAALAVSRDSKLIAVSGSDRERNTIINLYNAKNQMKIRVLRGFPGGILSLAYNQDGSMLAASSNRKHPRVWDLKSSKGYTNYSEKVIGHGDPYGTVRFSTEGNRVLYSSQFSTYMFELETAKLINRFKGGAKSQDAMGIAPNGKRLVTHGGFKVYDLNSFEELHKLERPHLMLRSIEFSPDGKTMYAGGHKEIKRFNTDTFEELTPFTCNDHYAWRIVASPDGKHLLVQNSGRLILVDTETGEKVKDITKKGKFPAYNATGSLAASANKKEVTIWNTTDWTPKFTLNGHKDDVNTLRFSPDGRFLASGSDDTSIQLWDVNTGKLVATLVALDREDYIVLTPDNYYMTSKGGASGVVFRKGKKLFPFEQFDLHFNRPDIILERLGYASQELIDAYKRSYLKRLKKTGFNEEDLKLDFHMPELYVINREDMGLESETGEIDLEIEASDSKYSLDRINIWINDVPIYGTNGIPLKSQKKNTYKKKIPVELLAGNNKIQVSVLNANGVESLRETINLSYRTEDVKPNLYLISIGASRYQQSAYNLTYASKDAKDIVSTFESSPAFGEVNTKTLVDEDVTKSNILALRSFVEQAGIHDVVMVFVAGHGLLDKNFDYYFATHDIDFDEPEGRGVEYSQLEGLLDGIKALKKILIMDTCHSGEVDKDEVEEDKTENTESGAIVFRAVGTGIKKKEGMGAHNTSELMKELFTDLRRGTGATVISSAGGAEYAMESAEWKNGLFTYCLLSSLKEQHSDLDNNGNVHLSELQEYVTGTVKQLSQGKQVPTCRMENLSLDYHVW